jgi:hypothetical protein
MLRTLRVDGVPRSLLTAAHGDADLRLTSGTRPDDLGGEIFLSAPAPHADLR